MSSTAGYSTRGTQRPMLTAPATPAVVFLTRAYSMEGATAPPRFLHQQSASREPVSNRDASWVLNGIALALGQNATYQNIAVH